MLIDSSGSINSAEKASFDKLRNFTKAIVVSFELGEIKPGWRSSAIVSPLVLFSSLLVAWRCDGVAIEKPQFDVVSMECADAAEAECFVAGFAVGQGLQNQTDLTSKLLICAMVSPVTVNSTATLRWSASARRYASGRP